MTPYKYSHWSIYFRIIIIKVYDPPLMERVMAGRVLESIGDRSEAIHGDMCRLYALIGTTFVFILHFFYERIKSDFGLAAPQHTNEKYQLIETRKLLSISHHKYAPLTS